MTTPEWLRPVSERFLGGDLGPPPWTVRAAAGFAAACALAAAGMVLTWAPMSVRLLRDAPVHPVTITVSALLAVTGAAMVAVFAPSVWLLRRRGWFRLPLVTATVLGVLTLLGLCVAVEPTHLTGEEGPQRGWAATAAVAPQLLATAVAASGLVLLLRSGSASSWLAQRRYQLRQGTGSGAEPAPELGRGD